MMCDTNWCTYCDNAISPYSDSLYCSENCLRQDASMCDSTSTYASNTFTKDFTYGATAAASEVSSKSHSGPGLPRLVRRKSSIPSIYCSQANQITAAAVISPSSSPSSSSNHVFFSQCIPVSSMTPSLSSSLSSSFSMADALHQIYEDHSMASFHYTKPQNSSYNILVERLNRAIIDL